MGLERVAAVLQGKLNNYDSDLFLPIILERLKLARAVSLLRRLIIPLVIMGVLLSTLHQSSLGTVFLIAPYKMNPLWYSPLLPVFFFVSAVYVGLAMTVFESYLSYRFFRKQLDVEVLDTIMRFCGLLLVLYFALKMIDLKNRDALSFLLKLDSTETQLFLLELAVGTALPVVLLMTPKVRGTRRGLFFIALLVILGFVLNRLNVSITAFSAYQGVSYFPSFPEFTVSAFMVAVGFVAFYFAVKYFSIFPEEEPFKQDYEDRLKAGLKPPELKKRPAL
jgi:Ni/Fe-hydrogenase subunit HybB-like protein